MNSEAKNKPPLKPEPIETADARDFRSRMPISVGIAIVLARLRCRAP
jgi:hypothetical protein